MVSLLLVLGPDGKSFRVFLSRIDGRDAEFFLQADSKDWMLVDSLRPPANGIFKAAPFPAPRRENVSTESPL